MNWYRKLALAAALAVSGIGASVGIHALTRDNTSINTPALGLRSYSSLERKLRELGLQIDERSSRRVPHSQRLVIHLQDIHNNDNVREKNLQYVQTIQKQIGSDAIGLESYAGLTNSSDIPAIRQRLQSSEEQRRTHKNQLIKEAQHYLLLSEQLQIQTQIPSFNKNALTNIISVIGDNEAFKSHARTLDDYANVVLQQTPIFGLDTETRYSIALLYCRAVMLKEGKNIASTLAGKLDAISERYRGSASFMDLQRGIQNYSNTITKEYDVAFEQLRQHEIAEVSPDGFVRHTITQRNEDWANAVAQASGKILITIGGKMHTAGYVDELAKRNISSIVINSPGR